MYCFTQLNWLQINMILIEKSKHESPLLTLPNQPNLQWSVSRSYKNVQMRMYPYKFIDSPNRKIVMNTNKSVLVSLDEHVILSIKARQAIRRLSSAY